MKELALIGFAQVIFFSIIILLKKKKYLKDFFLILFFVLVGVESFHAYILPKWDSELLILIDIVYWAFLGPSLYLYTRFVIEKDKKLGLKQLLHLIPLLISLVPIIDYFTQSQYNSLEDYFPNCNMLMKIFLYVVWEFNTAVYITITIIILLRHRKNLKKIYSNIRKKDLRWLLYLTIGFAVYIYSFYIFWALKYFFDVNNTTFFTDAIIPILTAYVFGTGIYGYKQNGIFYDFEIKNIKEIKPSRSKEKIKYNKSSFSYNEKNELKEKLQKLMKDKKPFLECELTISELAKELDTSIHKLSQLINESYNINFCDYINFYRVEEFKNQIINPKNKNFKIVSVAYDCGFNSKSTFYSIFKKHSDITPTEYRKKLQEKVIST